MSELFPNEVQSLHRILRDLVALSALPAIWAGQQPRAMAEGLAEAVRFLTRADFVYLSLQGLPDENKIEVTYFSGFRATDGHAQMMARALSPFLLSPTGRTPVIIPHPAGTGNLRNVVIPIGYEVASGIIVVGSQQPDFPTEIDHLLLTVAANQAMIWSQEARLIGGLKQREEALCRNQQELEERVLERTRELQALATRLQAIREEERTRVAREIHDELGGRLTGLKLEIMRIRKGRAEQDPELATRLNLLSEHVSQTIRAVQRIASELRPAILDHLGLPAAIAWQCREFQTRSGIPNQLTSRVEELILDPEQSTAIFRIYQETLTNIVRHAQATRVETLLERQGDHIVLQIRDNGCGISQEELDGAKSLGIVGMRERARLLSGELVIQGAPGEGTCILVKIPLTR